MERIERMKPYEAKRALTSVINKVSIGNEPIIFESRGKDLAVLISMKEFRLYQSIMDELQNRIDLEQALEALNDPEHRERIPWEALKRELRL
jgi:prevent-host-death family protein